MKNRLVSIFFLLLLTPGFSGENFPSQQPDGSDAQSILDQSRRFYEAARQSLENGQYLTALQNADAALRFDPKNWAAWYVRARVQIHNENWGEALQDTEKSLQAMTPGDAQGSEQLLILHALALNRLGQHGRALASAEKAMGLNPYNSNACIAKAWALAGLSKRQEALDALKLAAALNGKYVALYRRALELPQDKDMLAVFQGDLDATRPSSRRNNARIVLVWLCSLIGGLLVVLGFFHILATGNQRSRLKALFGRTTQSRRTSEPKASRSFSHRQAAAAVTAVIAGMYQVLRQLGVGGMGVVYEAVDRTLERKVAIKKMREEIRANPREKERFLHEARTVAALHHPNIVEIYSIVEEGSDVYLIFEHVNGKTVHEVIHEKGMLPFEKALSILRSTCAALDYAHRRNIIHRDLKPSNIMIDKEGRVKVMDFGVARQAKESLSRLSMTNTVVGTPPYMAPEQEQGMVRRESDFYALAVCLYEMVSGKLPFNGLGAGMLMAKLNQTYVPASRMAPDLPAGFDEVLSRALDPDPDKRWKTAADFLQNLEALAPR